MSLRRLRWLVASALAVLAMSASAAPASARIYFQTCEFKASYKPKVIQVCVGILRQVRKLHWTQWGGAKATARGRYVYQSCEPSCVDGKVLQFSMTRVVLYRNRYCSYTQKRIYTRMIISPKGRPKEPLELKLACRP